MLSNMWGAVAKFVGEVILWFGIDWGVSKWLSGNEETDTEAQEVKDTVTEFQNNITPDATSNKFMAVLDHAIDASQEEYALMLAIRSAYQSEDGENAVAEIFEDLVEEQPDLMDFASVALEYVSDPDKFEEISNEEMFGLALVRMGINPENPVSRSVYSLLTRNVDPEAVRARCFAVAFSTNSMNAKKEQEENNA